MSGKVIDVVYADGREEQYEYMFKLDSFPNKMIFRGVNEVTVEQSSIYVLKVMDGFEYRIPWEEYIEDFKIRGLTYADTIYHKAEMSVKFAWGLALGKETWSLEDQTIYRSKLKAGRLENDVKSSGNEASGFIKKLLSKLGL